MGTYIIPINKHTFVCFITLLNLAVIVAGKKLITLPLKKMSKSQITDDHNHRLIKRAVANRNDSDNNQLKNLRGQSEDGFFLEMGIGTPPQKFSIIIDTGSSNFAVAAAPSLNVSRYFNSSQSSTFYYDGREIYVTYSQGEWSGLLAQESVTMPSLPLLNITTDIAFISESSMFFINDTEWQGILGLGYSAIVHPDTSVRVFLDSIQDQSDLDDIFSIQLCENNRSDDANGGSLIFGGIDSSLYSGEILYAPIYKEWYYEIVMTDISINGTSLGLECKEYNFDKTIVDSGTTNLRLPKKVFDAFVELMIEKTVYIATYDGEIPLDFWMELSELCWPQYKTPWQDFPTVILQLAASEDQVFDLVIQPQQYLREVPVPEYYNQTSDCFKFAVTSSESGSVLGAVLMEGYYVVFDRKKSRVGFAQTTCQSVQPHVIPSSVSDLKNTRYNTTKCAYVKPEESTTLLSIAAYILMAVCGVMFVPFVIAFFCCPENKSCVRGRYSAYPIDENNLLDTNTMESDQALETISGTEEC